MVDLILASGSVAKRELLERSGLKFRVEESNFDEHFISKDPEEVVTYLALEKARVV